MTTTPPTHLARREFLVASAVVGTAALVPLAMGRPVGLTAPSGSSGSSGMGRPTLARLDARPIQRGAGEIGPPARRLVPSSVLSGLGQRVSECGLRVEPIASDVVGAEASLAVEVYYPAVNILHLVWAAQRSVHGEIGNPSGLSFSAGVRTLAPTDALGRVRLRVTTSGDHGSQTHRFELPSAGGSHLLAVPVTRSARTPAWRRCTASGDRADQTTIHDPWRPAHAAPGCVLLRLDLIPTTHGLNNDNPSASIDPADHGGD